MFRMDPRTGNCSFQGTEMLLSRTPNPMELWEFTERARFDRVLVTVVGFEYYFFWSAYSQTIRFYARYKERRIRCAVTRAALEDRVGSRTPLPAAQLEKVFEEHRDTIHKIAGTKVLNSRFQQDGSVLIRTSDLNC